MPIPSSKSLLLRGAVALRVGLCVLVWGGASPWAAEPVAVRTSRSPQVGMNLAPVADYGTNLPFVDVFKSSRSWIEKGGDIRYDAHGHPRLSPGQSVESLMVRELDGHYPSGEYVVTWEGSGEVDVTRFDVIDVLEREPHSLRLLVAAGSGGLLLEIRSSDPDDPVRDIHVWMPGFARAPRRFNPEFVDRLRPYAVLRFMEWQRTNGSPTVEWSDRPHVEDARYSTEKGVPLEVMIDLANQVGADPWFTLPHRASDDYVRRFATLVRDRLAKDRKVYVEYSNEVWNSMFSQSKWAEEKGRAESLSEDPFLARLRFYSERSVEVMRIFEEVFGGTKRLVRVAGSQAVSPWVSEKILEWKDAHRSFDALAIAPYFGGRFGKPETATEISEWSVAKLTKTLREEIENETREVVARQAEVAKKHELDLVAYEAGQHLVGYGGAENDLLLTDLFASMNRDPGMYDLYTEYLRVWTEQGGGLLVAFNDIGPPTKWGSWGVREYLSQRTAEAPKERALLERLRSSKASARRVVGPR